MKRELLEIVRADMKPAMGVTEPAAIAFTAAKAAELCTGEILGVEVAVNPGIYKNAYTCGIPNTSDVGTEYAAAIGCLIRNSAKGLLLFEDMEENTAARAHRFVESGAVHVSVSAAHQELYIDVAVKTASDKARVIVGGSHTNVCFMSRNEEILLDTGRDVAQTQDAESASAGIKKYSLEDFYKLIMEIPAEEIRFLSEAYQVNLALASCALQADGYPIARKLLEDNGCVISDNFRDSAVLLAVAAAEARVLGASLPAMSITGSGNHGIIATLPLYAMMKVHALPEECLWRATLLSYLITEYIKEYSGKLSAFCGCGIAAGTGMACALTWMRGGSLKQMEMTLANMASSITGMICTGGNHACCMKVIAAVDVAIRSSDLAMAGVSVDYKNGILAKTPEGTMRNMGRIAAPGMVETDSEILGILERKAAE